MEGAPPLFFLAMSGSEGWQPSRKTRAVVSVSAEGETLVERRGDPPHTHTHPSPRWGRGVGGGGWGSVSGNRCASHSQQLYLSPVGAAGLAAAAADGWETIACARTRALACLLQGARAATAPVFAPPIFTPLKSPGSCTCCVLGCDGGGAQTERLISDQLCCRRCSLIDRLSSRG